jgi:hypothetical protein
VAGAGGVARGALTAGLISSDPGGVEHIVQLVAKSGPSMNIGAAADLQAAALRDSRLYTGCKLRNGSRRKVDLIPFR